jgi:hypothetical protein
MEEYLKDMKGYWEKRFTKEGNIWGGNLPVEQQYMLLNYLEKGA